jgi:hypothetical protein
MKIRCLSSKCTPNFQVPTLPTSIRFRVCREHLIFEQLLQSVPGLEEKLVGGSDEHVRHVADLVRCLFRSIDTMSHANVRSKGALRQLGLTIPKR